MVYKLILLFFFFRVFNLSGQSVCLCTNPASIFSNSDSSEHVNCNTIYFKNHSALYTQYNCDSAWLSFQTPKGKKIILFSANNDSDMFDMDWKFAPIFIQEYNSSLLFGQQEVSAMGYPLSYSLLNKTTGVWEKELGHIIYNSEKTSPAFILYFKDDSLLNSVQVYVVDKRRAVNINLPKGRILMTTQQASEMFPENLFEEPIIKGTIVTIKYKYVNKGDSKHWKWETLKFDLAQYSR